MGDEKREDFEITCECKRFKDWLAKAKAEPIVYVKAAIRGVKAVTDVVWTSVGMALASEFFINEIVNPYYPLPKFLSICGEYKPLVQSFIIGENFEKTRNFAIMRGCNAGISLAMKNLTGKEDVQTSMVAGFGYGVVISLVTGMRGPGVLSVGVTFALFNAAMFKASRWGKAEDEVHNKTKGST